MKTRQSWIKLGLDNYSKNNLLSICCGNV